jgi:CysZ protein
MSEQRTGPPGFFGGLTYPVRGMRFVFRTHPGLVRYWIVPVAVALVAVVILIAALVQHREELAASVWTPPDTDGTVGWLLAVLQSLTGWVLAAVILAVGGVGILLTSNVVAAPFNDALSAAVERLEGTLPAGAPTLVSVAADVARSISVELGKLLLLTIVLGPLVVLNLALPVLGGALLAIVGPLITVSYIAIDYTDWPAARRGVGFRGRLSLLRRHPRALLGFGVCAWALLFVPGLNLLLMPANVVGGTLLFLDLEVRRSGEASVDRAVGPAFPS